MHFELVDQVISDLDRRHAPFGQFEVSGALYKLREDHQLSETEARAWDIEVAAWELRPGIGKPSSWGTYYHPLVLGAREDGAVANCPELADLDEDALAQWSERRQSLTNAFLRARYADVLWDLGHVIDPTRKRDFESGQIAVDAYMEQASAFDKVPDFHGAMALQRAFQIAAELNTQQESTWLQTSCFVWRAEHRSTRSEYGPCQVDAF